MTKESLSEIAKYDYTIAKVSPRCHSLCLSILILGLWYPPLEDKKKGIRLITE